MKKAIHILLLLALLPTSAAWGLEARIRTWKDGRLQVLTPNSTLSVQVGEEVYFDAMGSDGLDDLLENPHLFLGRYEWDFGDGYSLKAKVQDGKFIGNEFNGGTACTHIFMAPGNYTVNLTIWQDDSGKEEDLSVESFTKVGETNITVSVSGEPPMEGFEILYADFHGRIRQYMHVRIPAQVRAVAGNRLRVALKKGDSEINVLMDKDNLSATETFLLSNKDLPAGSYTLEAQLLGVGGGRLSVIREKFDKSYDGIPEMGIDENNAIRLNGELFFPVTPWLLSSGTFTSLNWRQYINMFYGAGYLNNEISQKSLEGWLQWIDKANDEQIPFIGPERYDGKGPLHFVRNSDPRKIAGVIEATLNRVKELPKKERPPLGMWMWHDEPNIGGGRALVPPQVVRGWTYLSQVMDPQHLTALQLYGASYQPYTDNPDKQHYPHMMADKYSYLGQDKPEKGFDGTLNEFGGKRRAITNVVGMDVYPFEYRTAANTLSFKAGAVAQFADAVDNLVHWNYSLLPVMLFIEVQDLRGEADGDVDPIDCEAGDSREACRDSLDAGPCIKGVNCPVAGVLPARRWLHTPAITPAELKMLIWTGVVHGAHGINWFHYHTGTPPAENLAVMKQFKDQITDLTPVVLGPDPEGISVTDDADELGRRVDTMVKVHDGVIYVFAVRITERDYEFNDPREGLSSKFKKNLKEICGLDREPDTINVTFTLNPAVTGKVSTYETGQPEPAITNGVFTDRLERNAVRVYMIRTDGKMAPGRVQEVDILKIHSGD